MPLDRYMRERIRKELGITDEEKAQKTYEFTQKMSAMLETEKEVDWDTLASILARKAEGKVIRAEHLNRFYQRSKKL